MSSIYQVKFFKSSFKLEDDYDQLSDIDKEKISNINSEAFFDFDEDDRYNFLIVVDKVEFTSYIRILNDNLIPFELKDISEDILKGNFDIESILEKSNNPLRFSFFLDYLDEWVYSNLDIDRILDRISEVGIGKLRKIEKEFLDNYNF
jgi:hypothetical protein